MLLFGILGGFLWGALPGALKAYTGAHEVITTIMLNFIAILIVDWLIKSIDPVILGDVNASVPKTPVVLPAAMLPTMDTITTPLALLLMMAAVAVVAFLLNYLPERRDNPQAARRSGLIWAGVMAALQLFLVLIAVGDQSKLHFGFWLMIAAVWLTDWFLTRTTLGFELRTVGANQNAAKYAGMSVPRNIVLAMALSGMLAGWPAPSRSAASSMSCTRASSPASALTPSPSPCWRATIPKAWSGPACSGAACSVAPP